jgi:hypothetical protein
MRQGALTQIRQRSFQIGISVSFDQRKDRQTYEWEKKTSVSFNQAVGYCHQRVTCVIEDLDIVKGF